MVAAWRRGASRAELLILLYRQERQGAEAVGGLDQSRLTNHAELPVRLSLAGAEVNATARLEEHAGRRQASCSWFWVDGAFTASSFGAKLRRIRLRLLGRAAPTARLQLILSGEQTEHPQAAIALKQGFGRLIRSRSDRGVLSILDNRVTRQRYGQVFFDSLPDYAFTTNLKDVETFWKCSK